MKFRNVIVAAALVTLSAIPSFAQSTTDVAAWASFTGFDSTRFVDPTDDTAVEISLDDTVGYGVSLNQYWTSNFSTELGATMWDTDVKADVEDFGEFDLGSMELTAIHAVGQWHFSPAGKIDPYVGAGVAYFDADDLEVVDAVEEEETELPVDSEASWVANAGVNFNFGRLALALDAKYAPYEPSVGTGEDEEDLSLNPLSLSAGLRFRF